MIVSIDFETRSKIGIEGGSHKYATHPSTEIICMAIKVDDGPTRLYWPDKWQLLLGMEEEISGQEAYQLIKNADRVEAHNAEFERHIWTHVVKSRFQPKWRCTMAKAAMHGLPLSLEKMCEALGTPIQKDKKGNMLMKKICSPQKDGSFIDDPEIFKAVGEYCRTDVEAQYCASRRLDDLSDFEQSIYELTLKKNRLGLPIDMNLVDRAIALWEEYEAMLKDEFQKLTGVPSPSCLQQFLSWLESMDCPMTDLRAASVSEFLDKTNLPDKPRRALEIRAELGKTSITKYKALKLIVEDDNRARGLFLYHGASTGRWAGRGFQPQNLPSRGLIEDGDNAVDMILNPNIKAADISLLWPSLAQVLSSVIRSAIKAPAGKEFFCADYSAIEARVLAWLAGEQWVLDAFERGDDLYIKAASKIYHKPEGHIIKSERQIGKVAVLACGYQGGKQAFANMAAAYGVAIDLDEAQGIVRAWREAHPNIVEWWHKLEDAALKAVRNPGMVFTARSVSFQMKDEFLTCALPSGRKLYYPNARVGIKETPWGEQKAVILYNTVSQGKWVETNTYGGKLAENITQAVARDLMAYAIAKLDDTGFDVLATIHDEILVETQDKDFDVFMEIMNQKPAWAKGLPIAAEGWRGERYKK